ncbi:hypothetical protein CTAYLR_005034 [Chrysophaeum taylorii]|uniref:Nuclear cap-binding protein subunit 1 n=1 Tax=Chrysophaeum taylorii TaxID=2483200 RepID=A0AAD7XHA5_9STRA|nr:hypothetical protein CTAYLR_005034 [Chrysophaeum taylorii]
MSVVGGVASLRLVQLLVRVADVHARATTDAGSSLCENLAALAEAAEGEIAGDAERVAKLVGLVARSSPLGVRAFGVLGALLCRRGARAAVRAAAETALGDALASGRHVDARLAARWLCELANAGACPAPHAFFRALATDMTEAGAAMLALCLAVSRTIALDDRRELVAELARFVAGRRADSLVAGVEALMAESDLAPNLETLEEALAGFEEEKDEEEEEEEGGFGTDAVTVRESVARFASAYVLPKIPGDASGVGGEEGGTPLTPVERFVASELAKEVCAAFRPGARWDGIVVGDRSQVAKQLLGIPEIFRDARRGEIEDLVAGVVLGIAASGETSDGSLTGASRAGDACLDALHVSLELCRESPSFAVRLAARIELVFRDIDEIDYCCAARLAVWFAHFLNNTDLKWPYWGYWATAVDDAPVADPQRRFLCNLFEALVRLSYVDRIKCADGFPEALHPYLPRDPTPAEPATDAENAVALAIQAAGPGFGDAMTAALEEDNHENDQQQLGEPTPLSAAFRALGDSVERCGAAARAALLVGRASVSHAMAALDAIAAPLGDLARGDENCEATCLDALASVWANSTFHVALFADAMVRRGILRPRALAAWVLREDNDTRWAAANIVASTAPLEIIDLAVDRSLDLVAAALRAAEQTEPDQPPESSELVADQLDEAKEVCLEIFARLVAKLDAYATAKINDDDRMDDDDDDDDTAVAWSAAALSVIRDLAARYDRARRACLEATRRSSPSRPLPRVFDPAHVQATVVHDGIEPGLADKIRACFLLG